MPSESREPLLGEGLHRFSLFPIKHPETFEFYLKHVASFWTVNEVDLTQDMVDFKTLSEGEQTFICTVLAFFASADGIVNENLATNFATEVTMPEARQFYGFQIGIETIHAHMYGLMIDMLVQDQTERMRLFNAVERVPSVNQKANWALRWIGIDKPFSQRVVAFACVEGIFFSASFCAIYFFKKRGKMPGLTFSNELIARDEGLHRDFACHMYTFIENRLPEATIHEIVKSAVDCEQQFVNDALRIDLIGMNAKLMMQYVEFVADHLVVTLGYNPIYGSSNPFEFMELIALPGKTNFFEKRVGEYQKAGVMQSGGVVQREFTTDADF